jgi:hypothetical protein
MTLRRIALAVLIFLASAFPGREGRGSTLPPGTAGSASPKLDQVFGKFPLYFIENRGQVGGDVSYYVQGRATTVYFTRRGVTFAFSGSTLPAGRWVLKLDFVGGRRAATPVGEEKTGAVVSYFKGPRERWKAGIPTYAGVVYRNLWWGIDLTYSGSVDRMKYTFLVRPGADPKRIRLRYRGVTAVRQDEAGRLEVASPLGSIRDDRPSAYQELDGRRVPVPVEYSVDAKRAGYGFRLGTYDRTKPLVIDPVVLIYCGYIGGGSDDVACGIAVDTAGSAYVAGRTSSLETTFPVLVGPDPTYNGGSEDAFVAKVKPAGTGLVYLGYIGGDGSDRAWDIAVDEAGSAYVVGNTNSDETTFPVLAGPDLTYAGGGLDVFVVKVDPAGTALDYCGYIGGTGFDEGYSIAVDSDDNAYVTGLTTSTEASFPVRVGPKLTYGGGTAADAYAAKVNAAGTALVYCGFIGGAQVDFAHGIAVDDAGAAYVVGTTASDETTFPVTVGPDLTYNGGTLDAFIAKVKPDGTGFDYAGYIGGNDEDQGNGVAVDSARNAYATGSAVSTERGGFPVLVGPDLTQNGAVDTFVVKVKPDGTGFVYAGFIGGAINEPGSGIAVDKSGNAYVCGPIASDETTFPVLEGPDLTYNGLIDAFVARVKADGTGLDWAGYIGGSNLDSAADIAVDAAGDVYVCGETQSNQATFPVLIGPDVTQNGASDAFVAKIHQSPDCADSAAPVRLLKGVKSGSDADFTWEPDPAAVGYNVWYVENKEEIDLARQASVPPAIPVCAAPNPAMTTECVDPGAVPRGMPAHFFYQVRVYCDPDTEGP